MERRHDCHLAVQVVIATAGGTARTSAVLT
jgi:hypothetical protein